MGGYLWGFMLGHFFEALAHNILNIFISMKKGYFRVLLFLFTVQFLSVPYSFAENYRDVGGMFDDKLSVSNVFSKKPEDVLREKEKLIRQELEIQKAKAEHKKKKELIGRVDGNAPDEFKDLVVNFRSGDSEGAERSAESFVGYLSNLMYEVRSLTSLIANAMVKQGVVENEEIIGFEQFMDMEFAKAREAEGSAIKPTHEESMKRIKPDSNGRAEVYYFFTLSSKFAREMSSDIERLALLMQKDPNVQIRAMAVGVDEKQMSWLKEFTQYTGLKSIPIQDGTEAAKAFRIGFVPALVVIAPSDGQVYIKTGYQDFERIYEFVKRVQGQSGELTPRAKQVMAMKIGENLGYKKETQTVSRNNEKRGKIARARMSDDKDLGRF